MARFTSEGNDIAVELIEEASRRVPPSPSGDCDTDPAILVSLVAKTSHFERTLVDVSAAIGSDGWNRLIQLLLHDRDERALAVLDRLETALARRAGSSLVPAQDSSEHHSFTARP
jgi:hypothetical protein